MIGGHSDELMMLTAETARGSVILATKVAHYVESIETGALFGIVSASSASHSIRGNAWSPGTT